MPDVILLLGPVLFQDFEIPSGINFGGRQRLALHRLPGGSRVIDAMGRDDAQIGFSGVFAGSDATLRARSLDEMRAAGIVVPLTWDVYYYTVLISDFHADYRCGWWIPYRVTCTVLRDEASALIQPIVSLAGAVLSDVGTGTNYAEDAGLDFSALQSTIAAPGARMRGTAAYTIAQSSLVDAQSSIDASINSANITLENTNIDGSGSAQDSVTGLLEASRATGQLSSLMSARSYVRRGAVNLANAST
jgi:hypothetical protein